MSKALRLSGEQSMRFYLKGFLRTTRTAGLGTSLILVGCDGPTASNVEETPMAEATSNQQIAIRTAPGEQRETASLVEPDRYLNLRDLAAALRRAGHACETVRAYDQLEQSGERMNVYKVDCLEYSYQLTFSDGKSHIKRWSGNIVSD